MKKQAFKSGILLVLIFLLSVTAPAFAAETVQQTAEGRYVYNSETQECIFYPDESAAKRQTASDEVQFTLPHPSPAGGADETQEGGIAPDSVIGFDDRARVINPAAHPHSYVVLMKVTFKNNSTGKLTHKVATGFMVGPDTILTAAHCIRQPGYTREEVRVYVNFGADDYTGPYYTPYLVQSACKLREQRQY